MIPKTDTPSKGTNVPRTKSSLLEVLVEEAPELNTRGKLSESKRKLFLSFKEFLKMHN